MGVQLKDQEAEVCSQDHYSGDARDSQEVRFGHVGLVVEQVRYRETEHCQKEERCVGRGASLVETLFNINQPSTKERTPEHKQQVADHRTKQLSLCDLQQPGSDGLDCQDHLYSVSEGGIQKPSYHLSCVHRQLLRGASNQICQWDQTQKVEDKNRRSTPAKLGSKEAEWDKNEECVDRGDQQFPEPPHFMSEEALLRLASLALCLPLCTTTLCSCCSYSRPPR
mmetsp:Transcript_26323/g.51745  ORF Transcript_26323/g.51745 Transcript_26323/m.51745 type:complete len:224 (-) Transcript_26323:518-1189(-)